MREEFMNDKSVDELIEEHKKWHYERTDRNGTRYFYDTTCPRCGGRGYIESYKHVDGGICFECGGSGVAEKPTIIKVYTVAHGAKLEAQRKARAEKKAAERVANAKAHRGEWLEKFGFGNEDGTYVVYRIKGDTFSIKDELKALGCKFQPSIGWYSARALDGYESQRMTEEQVLDTEAITSIVWKSKSEVEKEFEYEESTSEWVGNVGERIEKTFTFDASFESEYTFAPGYWGSKTSYLYLMSDEDGNVYKWSSSCFYMKGDVVKMKATVKDHAIYKGTKQTVVTRCTAVK